jgi:hypothetical protein
MAIGSAIFASVVLVLMVYNPKFRVVIAWAVGVGAVIAGIVIGVEYLREIHHAKEFHRELVESCVKRLDTTRVPPTGFSSTRAACEQWQEWKPQVNDDGLVYDLDLAPPWVRYASTGKGSNSDPKTLVIHGGETLRIIELPTQPTNNGWTPVPGSMTPIVYLGHNQKFIFWCGNYGEPGTVGVEKKPGQIECK